VDTAHAPGEAFISEVKEDYSPDTHLAPSNTRSVHFRILFKSQEEIRLEIAFTAQGGALHFVFDLHLILEDVPLSMARAPSVVKQTMNNTDYVNHLGCGKHLTRQVSERRATHPDLEEHFYVVSSPAR